MRARTINKSVPVKKTRPSSKPPKKSVAKPKAASHVALAKPVLGEGTHPSLRRMELKKKSVRLTFDSLTDLHLQTLALANHLEQLQTPAPIEGTTYLGRENAEAIVSDCAGSDDLTLTVAQCGKTGHGMQQCVEGKLTAHGYDPAPLHLNILDTDYLDTIATEIAKATK